MKQKRGQFFILGAVILVSLIVGVFLYTNQVFIQEYRTGIQQIRQEIHDETDAVINFYVARNKNHIENFIVDMTESLLTRTGSIEMIYFYGTNETINIFNVAKENITLLLPSEEKEIEEKEIQGKLETISVSGELGGFSFGKIDFEEFDKEMDKIDIDKFGNSPQNISFIWNGTNYNLDWLQENELYFILKQETGDQKDVVTGS